MNLIHRPDELGGVSKDKSDSPTTEPRRLRSTSAEGRHEDRRPQHPKTTSLYDRTGDEFSLDEIERVVI